MDNCRAITGRVVGRFSTRIIRRVLHLEFIGYRKQIPQKAIHVLRSKTRSLNSHIFLALLQSEKLCQNDERATSMALPRPQLEHVLPVVRAHTGHWTIAPKNLPSFSPAVRLQLLAVASSLVPSYARKPHAPAPLARFVPARDSAYRDASLPPSETPGDVGCFSGLCWWPPVVICFRRREGADEEVLSFISHGTISVHEFMSHVSVRCGTSREHGIRATAALCVEWNEPQERQHAR